MRKRTQLLALAAAGLLLTLAGCITTVSSGNANPPPGRGYRWGQGQPRLVIIEGTGISYAADCDEDIYLLDGIWYRYNGGLWFSCRTRGGNWVTIKEPPAAFCRIPPGHAKFHKVEDRDPGPPQKGPPPGHGPGRGPKWK
jgi:hypothetical protein